MIGWAKAHIAPFSTTKGAAIARITPPSNPIPSPKNPTCFVTSLNTSLPVFSSIFCLPVSLSITGCFTVTSLVIPNCSPNQLKKRPKLAFHHDAKVLNVSIIPPTSKSNVFASMGRPVLIKSAIILVRFFHVSVSINLINHKSPKAVNIPTRPTFTAVFALSAIDFK